jgi:hypothetical protein
MEKIKELFAKYKKPIIIGGVVLIILFIIKKMRNAKN